MGLIKAIIQVLKIDLKITCFSAEVKRGQNVEIRY